MSTSTPRTSFLSPEQRAEFERVVARFEQEWFTGNRPAIEPFLTGESALRSVLLAEMIRVDMEFRSKAGEQCRVEDYLARFPELANDVSLMQSVAAERPAVSPNGSGGRPASPAGKPVAPATPQPFDQRLIASRLVTDKQLAECLATLSNGGEVPDQQLAAEMLRRGWVTRWQLEQLLRGHAAFFVDQGRYVLLSLIGKGGMGAVYKARHVRMGRDVALKVIDPKRVTDQSLIQRFKREVEVCSKLQHEHIVQAFDVGEYAGATFLVLEFVEGSDLASLVKRDGPMQPGEAAALCLQAAAGLAYAHSQGVVHRDIKPQNILLSTSGVVKILDMGLARVLDEAGDDPHTSLTQEGAVMGTVDYMAPEQAADTRSADARSDIYSLGGTLYYLLAGRPPFAGGNVIEKMKRLALEDPQAISEIRLDCPRELDEIVQKMLAKRPEDRFQTAGDVVRALKPMAAERIAGRAAVTAAVQSAADTIHAAGVVPTSPQLSFTQFDESLATAVRQRQLTKSTLTRKQKVNLALILGALLVGIAVVGWRLHGPLKPSLPSVRKDPAETTTAAQPALKPDNIRRILPGHYGGIVRLAWSPDGKLLATGGGDGEVRIRDPNARQKKQVVYDAHRAGICNLVWSHDGRRIVSGDYFGAVHVWDTQTGKALARFERELHPDYHGYFNEVGGVAIAPDNDEIAYSERGDVVRCKLDGSHLAPLAGGAGAALRYSPSGKCLVSSGGPFVWEVASGAPVFGDPAAASPPSAWGRKVIGFTSDDRLLVADNKTIQLYDLQGDGETQEIPLPESALTVDIAVNAVFPVLAFSPGGDRCVFLARTQAIELSLPDGIERKRWKQSAFPPSAWSGWDVNFPNHSLAVLTNGFHVFPGVQVADFEAGTTREPFVNELFAGANGARLLGSRFLHATGAVFDLQTAERARHIPLNSSLVNDRFIRYLEEDQVVTRAADADDDGEVPPVVTLKESGANPNVLTALRLTDDGRRVSGPSADFSGDSNTTSAMRLWDAVSGELLTTPDIQYFLRQDRGEQSSLCLLSADGRLVAVSDGMNRVRVWRQDAQQPILDFVHASGQTLFWSTFSADGSRFADVAPNGRGGVTATIWSTDTGKRTATLDFDVNAYLDPPTPHLSTSGQFLVIAPRIWDISSMPAKQVWHCPEKDHALVFWQNGRAFRGGTFFPDERHVVIAQDAQFQIWDWGQSTKLATLFVLPNDEMVFVNHLTGHFSGSPAAYQFLYTKYDRGDGRAPVDVTLREYEQATGWKNDPTKAGLDLEQRNKQLSEKTAD